MRPCTVRVTVSVTVTSASCSERSQVIRCWPTKYHTVFVGNIRTIKSNSLLPIFTISKGVEHEARFPKDAIFTFLGGVFATEPPRPGVLHFVARAAVWPPTTSSDIEISQASSQKACWKSLCCCATRVLARTRLFRLPRLEYRPSDGSPQLLKPLPVHHLGD